jgi:hypothetical protein
VSSGSTGGGATRGATIGKGGIDFTPAFGVTFFSRSHTYAIKIVNTKPTTNVTKNTTIGMTTRFDFMFFLTFIETMFET